MPPEHNYIVCASLFEDLIEIREDVYKTANADQPQPT